MRTHRRAADLATKFDREAPFGAGRNIRVLSVVDAFTREVWHWEWIRASPADA